ncbi:hypothetical protein [Algoriphagus sp. PAP.12]|uniref:hypothetical protein n=1 Tax=Algoriphagus sp. PAP.12 TaxID=2996678 RepID=UPI00227A731C|nr:hypothetical protein [Algoriphagus sp. PAP.12]
MSVDKTIEKALQYFDAALAGLEVLIFPAEQILEAAGDEGSLVQKVSNGLFVLGILSMITSFGVVYARDVKLDLKFKWIIYPLLTVVLAGELFFIYSTVNKGAPSLINKVISFGKPIGYLLGGAAVITAMICAPKYFLNMTNIGRAIYLAPGIFALPPLRTLPFYPIVVLIRVGGKITQLSSQIIEIAIEDINSNPEPTSGDNQIISLT